MSEESQKEPEQIKPIDVAKGFEVEAKIFKARNEIKLTHLKKGGKNNHSNYEYFTPEQISELVNKACNSLNLLNLFSLVDETVESGSTKYYGVMNVIDLESGKTKEFKMQTFVPDIKATNAAQKIGGAVTYSERYLLMTIYDIKDNNLDFDNNNETDKKPNNTNNSTQPDKPKPVAKALTATDVEKKWGGVIYKGGIVYIDNKPIKPPVEQIEKLRVHPKFKEEK